MPRLHRIVALPLGRFAVYAAIATLIFAFAPQSTLAQTVSPSPASLSFGIPTGTSPALSAVESVTINITGSGSVTFTGASVSAGSPFAVAGNSCQNSSTTPPNTFTAPTTCQIGVTLTTTSTTLQTDTLVVSYTIGSSPASLSVPLSGAYGAIKLWDETNVTTSVNSASFSNMYTISSSGLNLSCPAGVPPTATISNTPDGLGYLLIDNYLTLAIGGNAVSTSSSPAGNVCTGGPADSYNGSSYNDCFSTNYQVPAGTNYSLNGDDPDSFTNPGNTVLTLQSGNQNNAGGVPPLNVAPFFSQGAVQATFTALDAGYAYTSSTVFLVTNCSPAGVVSGGSVTLNPINTSDPSTQTQTATFSSSSNQNISFTTSDTVAIQQGTTTIPSGIVPIVTDYGIPQQLFYQLVAGTSAGPAVCMRMSGELDTTVNPPAPMCKGYLLQCYNPSDGTTSGDNCAPSADTVRNLFFSAQFDSPDGPVNGYNFLYGPVGNPAADACSNVVPGGSCANGTGAGLLMGGDNWLTLDNPMQPPTTTTSTVPATYSPSNCVLTGTLAGALCPFDILTQFKGAADTNPGGTKGGNSLFIPVVNVPLPTATATVTGQNGSGWLNTNTINATFNSNAASYSGSGNVPPTNGFTSASPYSLTYGISTWPNLPDTTYPVAGDVSNQNSNTYSSAPFCTFGQASGNTPPSFVSTGTFSSLSDGIYNLHYFTTDCAFTEGLVFNPQGSALTDPTANWASFPFVTVGVDTSKPQQSSCSAPPPPVYNGWYKTNFSQACTVTDTNYSAGTSGSGFLPLLPNSIQGSQTETVPISTNAPANAVSLAVNAGPTPGCDLAGNCISVSAGPYNFDTQPPTIAVVTPASGATYSANQKVNAAYSCSDGAGSGVSSCTGTVANNTAISTVPNGISTPKTFSVTATDNVGNTTTSTVNYSVSCHYVAFSVNPSSVNPGSLITITASAMDCMSTSQSISLEFIWTGPVGKSCTMTKTLMFQTPYFTMPAGKSESISFPYLIPKTACAATHTLTTDTFIAGAEVDSTTVSLIVK